MEKTHPLTVLLGGHFNTKAPINIACSNGRTLSDCAPVEMTDEYLVVKVVTRNRDEPEIRYTQMLCVQIDQIVWIEQTSASRSTDPALA